MLPKCCVRSVEGGVGGTRPGGAALLGFSFFVPTGLVLLLLVTLPKPIKTHANLTERTKHTQQHEEKQWSVLLNATLGILGYPLGRFRWALNTRLVLTKDGWPTAVRRSSLHPGSGRFRRSGG